MSFVTWIHFENYQKSKILRNIFCDISDEYSNHQIRLFRIFLIVFPIIFIKSCKLPWKYGLFWYRHVRSFSVEEFHFVSELHNPENVYGKRINTKNRVEIMISYEIWPVKDMINERKRILLKILKLYWMEQIVFSFTNMEFI